MSKKRLWTIIGSVVLAIVVICGGIYWNLSHAVAKNVPGNTYMYTSVSKDKSLYVTFAKSGNQAIVTPDRKTAITAQKSDSNFNQAYKEQSKAASWNYKAEGNQLTLAEETKDGKVSQWQYNNILSTSKKFTSGNFTYQISKAGQGEVKNRTVFERIN